MIFLFIIPALILFSWFLHELMTDSLWYAIESEEFNFEPVIWQLDRTLLIDNDNDDYSYVMLRYKGYDSSGLVVKYDFHTPDKRIVTEEFKEYNALTEALEQAYVNLLNDNSYENFEKEWNRVSSIKEWC